LKSDEAADEAADEADEAYSLDSIDQLESGNGQAQLAESKERKKVEKEEVFENESSDEESTTKKVSETVYSKVEPRARLGEKEGEERWEEGRRQPLQAGPAQPQPEALTAGLHPKLFEYQVLSKKVSMGSTSFCPQAFRLEAFYLLLI
jgi:hypothetical protein